ncbi:MAG: LemA family protein [Acidobacteria bacterium]|nr:LemA family protein [Acidobacteriota bacterium]
MSGRIIFRILAFVVFSTMSLASALAQLRQAPTPKAFPTQSPSATATQAPAKPIKRDEVFFSIARLINSKNESSVSAISAEVDGVIEITDITYRPDGKAEVTVKERTPSSAAYTNRSSRLLFAPPETGEKWTWVEFEDGRRFYPVERLFPFVKSEMTKRKQMTTTSWNAFLAAIGSQGEAATKVLETAKAVIKAEIPITQQVLSARNAFAEAMKEKENKYDEIINAYNDLSGQTIPINSLGDTYIDLKANDAYLRLQEAFKNAVNATNAARKNYVQTVDTYNELLVRLPFAYVAYGLQFTRIEAKVKTE